MAKTTDTTAPAVPDKPTTPAKPLRLGQQIKVKAAPGRVLHNPELGEMFSSEKTQAVTVTQRVLRLVDDGDLIVV